MLHFLRGGGFVTMGAMSQYLLWICVSLGSGPAPKQQGGKRRLCSPRFGGPGEGVNSNVMFGMFVMDSP
jgi:hypothetical protein